MLQKMWFCPECPKNRAIPHFLLDMIISELL
nr:MAG TPA: Histone acetyltransferase [Caudoviricetes sp.]